MSSGLWHFFWDESDWTGPGPAADSNLLLLKVGSWFPWIALMINKVLK